MKPYLDSYNKYKRFKTTEVNIGSKTIGGKTPVLVQSMTTTDTLDTEGTIQQSVTMIEAGCELVRITAPSIKEAENLKAIKEGLEALGYKEPIVADIHFTPNAAMKAADYVEKIRVNPGNYADKKKFEEIEYTDASYQEELDRIREKFTPLVLKCKELGRAMRIGTNHGSLSDRIMSRYGDSPMGMVMSAIEFIEICRDNDYHSLVLSMKASNTLVMVQAYRLLVSEMKARGYSYPIHLGVTEAGEGEDGRIKSAVGIGALLLEGIGDTVRVSLTEAPEAEIPVAEALVKVCKQEKRNKIKKKSLFVNHNPYTYARHKSKAIGNIGGDNVPSIIVDLPDNTQTQAALFNIGYRYAAHLDKWNIGDMACDMVFSGNQPLPFALPGTLLQVGVDIPLLSGEDAAIDAPHIYAFAPSATVEEILEHTNTHSMVQIEVAAADTFAYVKHLLLGLKEANFTQPLGFCIEARGETKEEQSLYLSAFAGSLLIDGFGDFIWLKASELNHVEQNQLAFGILQATRTRISKTEYISCPSCGRTLFDLQETTAKIRQVTNHLKGVKIGIMGCIVNGPGEMADADFGYVGTGPGKISLYREKEVVRKNVPEEEAVDALVELIKEHNMWTELSAE
jgi:(E)-4-hydroxy-3-methylbut-2-enyl-diphosphate synthase